MKKIMLAFMAFYIFNMDTVIGSSRPVLSSQKMFSSGRRAPISFANVRKVQSKDTSMVAPEINPDDANESAGELFQFTVKDFLEEDLNEKYFDEIKSKELDEFPVVTVPFCKKSSRTFVNTIDTKPVYESCSFAEREVKNTANDDLEKVLQETALSCPEDLLRAIASMRLSEDFPNVIIRKNVRLGLERKPINADDLLFNLRLIDKCLEHRFFKNYKIRVQSFKQKVELSCLLLMNGLKDISITAKFLADVPETPLNMESGKYYYYKGWTKNVAAEFIKIIEDKLKKNEKFDCTVCTGDYSSIIQSLVLGYEFTLSKD